MARMMVLREMADREGVHKKTDAASLKGPSPPPDLNC